MVSSAVAVLLLSQCHLPFIASWLHNIKLLIKSSHEKKRTVHYTDAGTFQGSVSEEWWSTISANSIHGHLFQFPPCPSMRQYPESLSVFTLRLSPFLLLRRQNNSSTSTAKRIQFVQKVVMDLLCHKLLFSLLNEAQWVRRGDARHFHFKEPRAFDVPVTLLVFLQELQQSESAAECRQRRSCSVLKVRRFPAGLV